MRSSKDARSRFRFLFWRTDFVGIAMIVSGLFILLVNFKVIPASDFVLPRALGILFIMGGLLFLFLTGAGGWLSWFVIPAGTLLTSGLVTLVFGLHRFITLPSAALFSVGVGLTFLAVFFTSRNHWWALLPAGTLFGLASWIVLGSRLPLVGWHPVTVIFFLGLSFTVVYLYSVQKRRMRWSLLTGSLIIVASLLYLLGLLLSRWSMLWPALLLLAGLSIALWIMLADRRKAGRG